MSPIRVHFGPMPSMLRAIIGDLLGEEPDIVIVGNSSPGNDDCLRAAREQKAEIIIAQDALDGGTTCLDLILADPPLGVLAVAGDGRSAAGVSLARAPVSLEAGSSSGLADAIRRLVGQLGVPADPATAAQPRHHSQSPPISGGAS